ncbi:hypothetical protein OS493_027189 [Desmophyllum pertusum]|uniref:Acyl-CoA thioester hydrolase/bile acid-CoA amino acid N-acetyltransferase domain-containing protein n=1 Tax=Desmophyllum pertusum TaxID=174260 RepID=A0A9W9ZL39_9CNID|nr:hypothetical protein OS493_027189 [Desmophyllum pertusum]
MAKLMFAVTRPWEDLTAEFSSMGLLWSMKPAPGQRKGIRLMKTDVTKPYNIQLKCFDDHISPHESSLQPLSSVTFQKGYMTDGVKRIVLKGERFRGMLFYTARGWTFSRYIRHTWWSCWCKGVQACAVGFARIRYPRTELHET